MSFPCTRCGACCLNIGNTVSEARNLPPENITELGELYAAFPYNFSSTGRCEMFDESIPGCSVYETRPDVCKVDYLYETHYKQTGLTFEDYYLFNAYCCNLLMDKFGIPAEKKVLFKIDDSPPFV
jgi:uncharacterized protein